MINFHRSIAFIRRIQDRYAEDVFRRMYGRLYKVPYSKRNRIVPITDQVRYVIRMAYACAQSGVPYNVEWSVQPILTVVSITVQGPVIPTVKPLPKESRLKIVSEWKPTVWDAEYSLEALIVPVTGKYASGFVIRHSSGLALVKPSNSGELGITAAGENDDIHTGWCVIHSRTGRSLGLELSFVRAVKALLIAAQQPVDSGARAGRQH